MKRWLATLLLLSTLPVFAGEAILTWTPPTENTDGTPYVDPAGFKIYFGLTAGGPYPTEIDIPDPVVDTYTVTDLSPMTYYFVSTAYNQQGVESDFSNEATKTIIGEPSPPTDLTVGASNLYVYYISQSEDVVVLIPTGTVPEGTVCDGTMTVNGHYMVPKAEVSWIGSVRPPVVFALCQ